MKKNIAIITNAKADSGVGSRAHQIALHMPKDDDFTLHTVVLDGGRNAISVDGSATGSIAPWPSILGAKSISWMRLAKNIPAFDGYDLSNQTLSFIAKTRAPSIVTVHDIIELTNPQHPLARILNKRLLSGITQANHIIAVSEYVKKEIVRYFGISENDISVIYNGVNEHFKPIEDFKNTISYHELVKSLQLPKDSPIILSVGSDHPRKNLATTLRVISKLKEQYPNVLLLKIGEPGFLDARKEFLHIIDELKLKDNIRILGKVSQEMLLGAYHVADALLLPSRQEGFGMPILEAMASGCPVVCSNSTSLPEIVGDAGIMHSPDDVEGYTKSISELFESGGIKESFTAKGFERSKMFSWNTAALQTLELYKKYL